MRPTKSEGSLEVVLAQYGRSEDTYPLTAVQRAALRADRLAEAVEVEPGRYALQAERFVGTSVLPELRLIVRPRFGSFANVFFLLGYGNGLTKWGDQQFPHSVEADFFKAMAWLFDAEVAAALRFGVLRDYEEREELLPTLRGRPNIAGQLRAAPGRPYPLACRFVEFLEDTAMNRVIKAALRAVRRVPGLDPRLALRLRHHLAAFGNVADVAVGPTASPPPFNRLNEHWKGAATLASLILSHKTLRDHHGRTLGITFAVDMNLLFEAFVRKVVGQVARREGFELAPEGRKFRFSDKAWMKPDLVVQRDGITLAVADAKYKAMVPDGTVWSHENLYQLLAYCITMELDTGMLIYAESGSRDSVQVTKGVPKALRTQEISLRGSPAEITARAETVAMELVDLARARLGEPMYAASG